MDSQTVMLVLLTLANVVLGALQSYVAAQLNQIKAQNEKVLKVAESRVHKIEFPKEKRYIIQGQEFPEEKREDA